MACRYARQMHYESPYGGGAAAGHGHGDHRAWRGTTVLCVQRDNKAVRCQRLPEPLPLPTRAEELGSAQVLIADGQVSMGDVVFKSNVQKVRRFGAAEGKEGNIVAGFAGAPPPVTCDCASLQSLDQLD